MIQDTGARSSRFDGVTGPIVVCDASQDRTVIDQLLAVGIRTQAVLVEPAGRNTAPAVAAAALQLDTETVMAVFPSDHLVIDNEAFDRALEKAVDSAVHGALVTFGVVPTRPDTGFGYIEAGESVNGVAAVRRFVEKPDRATAEGYISAGYLWNSGMFVFTAGAILEEMREWAPGMVEAVAGSVASASRENDGSTLRLGLEFQEAPSVSIDESVMEKTARGAVVSLDAGWSDLGSWNSLWEVESPQGETVVRGQVYTDNVERSYIRSESRPVAVIGLDDVIVVETSDAVLVMDRHSAQAVRPAAEWFAGLPRVDRGSPGPTESP